MIILPKPWIMIVPLSLYVLRYLYLCAIVPHLPTDAWQAEERSEKLGSGTFGINKAYCYWDEQSSASHNSFMFSLLRSKMSYKYTSL